METFYWKDLEDPATGAWQGLLLRCQEPGWRAPMMRLSSGRNGRLQWMAGDRTLFWATQARSWMGLWFVCAQADLPLQDMPITPIDSAQVERGKTWAGDAAWFKNWSRFFADQLRDRPGSFLHNGQWLMRGLCSEAANDPGCVITGMPAGMRGRRYAAANEPPGTPDAMGPEALRSLIGRWRLAVWGSAPDLPNWHFSGEDLAETLASSDPVQWLDWFHRSPWRDTGGTCANLLALRQPRDDEGRVRWWRKKAREQALPPILALYLSGLEDCIIVDGHCRLRAALLEGIAPDIIVMALIGIYPKTPPDPTVQQERRERVIASIMAEKQRRDGKFISVDQLNKVLISLYDDTPGLCATSSHAWARIEEDRWRAEVRDYLTRIGRTEHLERILEREEP